MKIKTKRKVFKFKEKIRKNSTNKSLLKKYLRKVEKNGKNKFQWQAERKKYISEEIKYPGWR